MGARVRSFLAAWLALGFIGVASPHEFRIGAVTIDHPWARATIGTATVGAAYMNLELDAGEADRLIAVSTPVAERAEIHESVEENGVVSMRRVDAVDLLPGVPVALKPGGRHVMLMGLTEPLIENLSFPMTLVFEHAGSITVEVYVEGIASQGEGD